MQLHVAVTREEAELEVDPGVLALNDERARCRGRGRPRRRRSASAMATPTNGAALNWWPLVPMAT